MTTGENICYNIMKGDGYLFSQSIRGAIAEMKNFVTSEEGYVEIGDEGFKMKSRIVPTKVWITDERNRKKEVVIDQKQIAFYSPEYDRRAKYDQTKILEKIKEQEKYNGYYLIVTRELDMLDNQVIDAYRGLWKIEESFKIT